MGRSPCCEKIGLKKGPWTPEEDQKLLAYIEEHGHGSWRALPAKAGGRPSQHIYQSAPTTRSRTIGTPTSRRGWRRWGLILSPTAINGALTGKADNKSARAAASLSHMAQWESACLEAEARLALESKMRTSASSPTPLHAQPTNLPASAASPCLDVLHALQADLESPTSTLTFTGTKSGMMPTLMTNMLEISESNSALWHQKSDELDIEESNWQFLSKQQGLVLDGKEREENLIGCEEPWFTGMAGVGAGFTGMLLDGSTVHDTSECWGESNNAQTEHSSQALDEDKNYWSGILGIVNSELPIQSSTLL